MRTILLISPYWKESHRWMVSSVKLAELWQRLGYRVVVACMGDVNGVEDVSPTLTIHRRKDTFIPDPWNYGIAVGFGGYVTRLAKELKPDVIVINKLLFWTSLSILSLRLRGFRPFVLTDALVGMTWWPRGALPKFCARIYAWTAGWLILLLAKRVVFFHPQPETLLRTLGIAKKSDVIPTGIDPAKYTRPSSSSSSSDSSSSSSSSITVTYVGRLESIKGVDDFLAAVRPLLKTYPSLTAKVVGWYKPDHPLVREYDREVQFLGLRDDIPAILAETDIFVLPSHSEGLSNALMEAMSSSCVCIASDVGGNAFLIQNGISGFLFPAGDQEALRSHLKRLIDDPAKRRAMGASARQRIEQEFSWEKVGEKYERLFGTSV